MELPTEVKIISHKPIIGKLIVAYKKLIGLIIAPYLRSVFEKEHEIVDAQLEKRFEGRMCQAEVRLSDAEKRMRHSEIRLDDLEHGMRCVDGRFDTTTRDILRRADALFIPLDEGLRGLNEWIGSKTQEIMEEQVRLKGNLEKRHEELGQNVCDMSRDTILQKRRLDLILSELRKKTVLDNGSVQKIVEQKEHLQDHSYFIFEDRIRCSRNEIKKRQEIYLPIFKDIVGDGTKNKKSRILDIGCGRGEFLELLQENSIPAKGIDLNEDMVYTCKERGLQVEQAEAISYLKKLKDNTIGGIITCQFIEHLSVNELIEFTKLCYSKIKKGGKLVFETLNPESLYIMRWFYIDMSHQKPIHPRAISFLLESIGFYNIEVKYTSPVSDDFKLKPTGDKNIEKLNEFLFGDQEYAVIAEK